MCIAGKGNFYLASDGGEDWKLYCSNHDWPRLLVERYIGCPGSCISSIAGHGN
jgi:hypothetical protein